MLGPAARPAGLPCSFPCTSAAAARGGCGILTPPHAPSRARPRGARDLLLESRMPAAYSRAHACCCLPAWSDAPRVILRRRN